MDLATATTRARDLADRVIAVGAAAHDRAGSFPRESVKSLSAAGFHGLMVPEANGGSGLGPRALADLLAVIAEADGSTAMIYLMHLMGTAAIVASPNAASHAPLLSKIAAGEHLTTLAFSERGSRSHFWAPVSRAEKHGTGVRITANKSWVTSAGEADSMVVSTLSSSGKGPTDSTLYLVDTRAPGVKTQAPWDGMGLRANASAAMMLEGVDVGDGARLTDEGAGFKTMLEVVLPLFNLGSAAVALGLCRATIKATVSHLKTAQFEHMGQSLGHALPTLRAQLATMQIQADQLAALINDTIGHIENPGPATMLRVLEVKAAAGETAIAVTALGMRICGGAAFSKHTGIERFFRDAQAGAVMAPTVDVLREFIGKALLDIPLF